MSVLSSLVAAYDRLPDAPPLGYSPENVGAAVALNADGSVAGLHDLRDLSGRKAQPARLLVPQPVKRTAGIAPNFLWDKTAYALGVTAGAGKRIAEEHEAFRVRHAEWLAGTGDEGLLAFTRFLDRWRPEDFTGDPGLLDQNIVFVLEADRMARRWLHDRPAARALWAELRDTAGGDAAICLASGRRGRVARLHPAIKGVWGAQSSGASLVSFNLDAFESYGHSQGENAPVSEESAFAYGAALNRFLARDSGHRVQVGDASVVFWAEAEDAGAALLAVAVFAASFNPPDPDPERGEADAEAAREVARRLEQLRQGVPLAEIEPRLAEGVRFTVLGLAPNAARLSVRFMVEDSFGAIAANYQRFQQDIRIEDGRDPPRGLFRYLIELATQQKSENIPPNLAGDWLRAILTGTPYPLTLLGRALMRIRADGRINAARVGAMRAVLVRNFNMEVPMGLSPDYDNTGYQLGRLFAVYEQIQYAALGSVNASIRDKFYGSASATPQQVFGMLDKGAQNHLAKLGKQRPGHEVALTKRLRGILDRLTPEADPFPKSLPVRDQALFALGYHHEHSDFFRKKPAEDAGNDEVNA